MNDQHTNDALILVLNCGSSSIKFALFDGSVQPLPREPEWGGKVEGITDQNGIRTIHLYKRTPPKDAKEDAIDKYLSEYGMYFVAAWEGVHEVRIEIDGLSEHRTSLLFSDMQSLEKRGDQLLVINLAKQFGNKT